MDSRYEEMVWKMGYNTLASWFLTRFLNELPSVFNVFVPLKRDICGEVNELKVYWEPPWSSEHY